MMLDKFSPIADIRRILVLGVLSLTLASSASVDGVAADDGFDPDSAYPCRRADPLMDPIHEVLHGQDVVWQIPANPKAVLFMAHATGKEPFSYFDPGPRCRTCYGLPMERVLVMDALKRNYAVIVIRSVESSYVAWPIEESLDLVLVPEILKEWMKDHSLETLPLTAFGYSHGGFLVTTLTMMLPIRGLVIMACEGQTEVIMDANSAFPPTFYIYMPRDWYVNNISSRAKDKIAILRERGVYVEEYAIWPKRLTPHIFAGRTLCLSNETSEKMFAAYDAEGWIDENGYLKEEFFVLLDYSYENPLRKWNAVPFCKELDHICFYLHIREELRRALAIHTLTTEPSEKMFAFLDASLSSRKVEHGAG